MTTHTNPDSIFSLSFAAHSSSLEDTAARVIRELSSDQSNPDSELDFNPICDEIWAQEEESRIEENEDEFEFPLISRDWVSSPVSKYPVFNTDLLREAELVMGRGFEEVQKPPPVPEKVIRLPLKMLFEEEREKAESEELNGIPVGTYCVWKPKKTSESEADEEEERRQRQMRRWSNKSGLLSRRWKWPEILHRSNSDIVGKGRLVFFDPVKNNEDKKVEEKVVKLKMAAVLPEKLAEHGGGDRRRWIWSGSFNKANGMSWS